MVSAPASVLWLGSSATDLPGSVREFDPARGPEGPLLGIDADVTGDQVAHRDELHALRPDLDPVPEAGVLAREPERARMQWVCVLADPCDPAAAAHVPRLLARRVEVQLGVVRVGRHLVLR